MRVVAAVAGVAEQALAAWRHGDPPSRERLQPVLLRRLSAVENGEPAAGERGG
jgi:hypothetical protein